MRSAPVWGPFGTPGRNPAFQNEQAHPQKWTAHRRLLAGSSGQEAGEYGLELAAAPTKGSGAAVIGQDQTRVVGVAHEHDGERAGDALQGVEERAVRRVEVGVV